MEHLTPEQQQRASGLKEIYLEHLLEARRRTACASVVQEVEAGFPVSAAYLHVIQPAMYTVGKMWQNNEIDVTTEHYCTAATQLLMAQLFPYALGQPRNGLSMVGCCLGSELHELGMRMVCDFFEFSGWDTYFTGAVTPGDDIVRAIAAREPDLVCLSATMFTGIPQVRDVVHALRQRMKDRAPKVMAGGLAFMVNPELWRVVGADGTARNAPQAVATASALLGIGKTAHA